MPPDAASSAGRGASAFLLVRGVGCVATTSLLITQGIFRGLGDTVAPMWASVLANGVNLVLDPVFIFVLGWGVAGAALATVAGHVVSVLWLLRKLALRLRLRLAPSDALRCSVSM